MIPKANKKGSLKLPWKKEVCFNYKRQQAVF
jgi:hypothetical protein